MTSGRAGQHTLSQHEEPRPQGKISWGAYNGREAVTESLGPAVPGTLRHVLESRDVSPLDG